MIHTWGMWTENFYLLINIYIYINMIKKIENKRDCAVAFVKASLHDSSFLIYRLKDSKPVFAVLLDKFHNLWMQFSPFVCHKNKLKLPGSKFPSGSILQYFKKWYKFIVVFISSSVALESSVGPCLGPCPASVMELFGKNNWEILEVSFFAKDLHHIFLTGFFVRETRKQQRTSKNNLFGTYTLGTVLVNNIIYINIYLRSTVYKKYNWISSVCAS